MAANASNKSMNSARDQSIAVIDRQPEKKQKLGHEA
jgi:hypothetical protein